MLPLNALVELTSLIQGHPDTGGNWQEKCNSTLKSLGWERMVHEPYLYCCGKDISTDIIMCRQIDDKLFTVLNKEDFDGIVTKL